MSSPRAVSYLRPATVLFFLLVFSASSSFADNNEFGIDISNFGKINDNYYRGGQPDAEDMFALKKLGVKTVIDLQKGGEAEEEAWAAEAGLKFFKIPLSSTRRPTAEQTEYFLKLVNDPDNLPVYVHCAAGKHRTGSMTAIYRITHDSWTAERAFEEMDDYGYYGFPNHGAHKKHVFEYYDNYLRARNQDRMIPQQPAVSGAPAGMDAVN